MILIVRNSFGKKPSTGGIPIDIKFVGLNPNNMTFLGDEEDFQGL